MAAVHECPVSFGTCAWTHDDWRGVFYPEHLAPSGRLAWYARFFGAVEVDSTFYHPPPPKVAAHWAEVTPAGFRFSCKVPREITHEAKLRDCGEPLAAFLRGIEPLGEKLACLLIQLPPWFAPQHDEHALREFLRHLPAGFPWAVEFRDHAWRLPRIAHLLEQHSVCWAWSDQTTLEGADAAAFDFHPRTAPLAVIRLMGDQSTKYRPDGSLIHHYDRLRWPRTASLENWAAKIQVEREHLREILVFANNHFEGFSPLTAQRLAGMLGTTLALPRPAELHPSGKAAQPELWD